MPLLELAGVLRIHPVARLSQALRNASRVRSANVVVVVPFADHHPAVGRQGLPDALHKGGGMPILVHQSMVAFVGMNGGCGGVEYVSAMHEMSNPIQIVQVVENPLVSLRWGVRAMRARNCNYFGDIV